MKAYTELMKLLGRILTSTEMTNLRAAMSFGAFMLLRGEYTIDQIKEQARKICSLIRAAHIIEVSKIEESLPSSFIDICRDLVTSATVEQALSSTSRIHGRIFAFSEEHKKKELSLVE